MAKSTQVTENGPSGHVNLDGETVLVFTADSFASGATFAVQVSANNLRWGPARDSDGNAIVFTENDSKLIKGKGFARVFAAGFGSTSQAWLDAD